MPYPGGKSGAGVYQTIINRMPPHRVYIEPFLGGAAIMRLDSASRPATASPFSAPTRSPATSLSIATRPICSRPAAAGAPATPSSLATRPSTGPCSTSSPPCRAWR